MRWLILIKIAKVNDRFVFNPRSGLTGRIVFLVDWGCVCRELGRLCRVEEVAVSSLVCGIGIRILLRGEQNHLGCGLGAGFRCRHWFVVIVGPR